MTSYDKLGDLVVKFSRTSPFQTLLAFLIFQTLLTFSIVDPFQLFSVFVSFLLRDLFLFSFFSFFLCLWILFVFPFSLFKIVFLFSELFRFWFFFHKKSLHFFSLQSMFVIFPFPVFEHSKSFFKYQKFKKITKVQKLMFGKTSPQSHQTCLNLSLLLITYHKLWSDRYHDLW